MGILAACFLARGLWVASPLWVNVNPIAEVICDQLFIIIAECVIVFAMILSTRLHNILPPHLNPTQHDGDDTEMQPMTQGPANLPRCVIISTPSGAMIGQAVEQDADEDADTTIMNVNERPPSPESTNSAESRRNARTDRIDRDRRRLIDDVDNE